MASMATLKELRDERLRKLEELKKLDVNPYPSDAQRTNPISEVTDKFDQLEGQRVIITGRITSIRKFGKIAFIVIRDQSGQVQLFLKEDTLSDLASKRSW